jgi:hypothetical protein
MFYEENYKMINNKESVLIPKEFLGALFAFHDSSELPTTLKRLLGKTVQERRKFYEEQNKIDANEFARSREIAGEAKAFVRQFSELEISIHCILKQENPIRRIEKENASLIIPDRIIQEKRKSLTEPPPKPAVFMEQHIGKIKRSSYLAYSM